MAAEVGPACLSVRRYEAGPPLNMTVQVDNSPDTFSTTKEEEWVTKKKTELTTTRQIETRVQRQVVLEDGQVVEDTGPVVTTNTTEDTQKQEQKSTEHRTTGGDELPGDDWVAVPSPAGVMKEVTERTVKTREEQEARTETEDISHLGDMSDETYLAAVTSGEDILQAIGRELVITTGPRLISQSKKSKRVVDTADSKELSQIQPDGRIITETRRTTQHEEENDQEVPDDGKLSQSDEETKKESSHRFVKTKDQDLVEYLADGVKIGEEMRYNAENVEGERTGDPADMALHQKEWDSLSSRIHRMRRQTNRESTPTRAAVTTPGTPAVPLDRKDALTKKPLDFDQEEETRKVETSKWLTHHFGSESRSSQDDEDDDLPAAGTNTSFINVTMKSRPIPGRVTSPVNGHSRLATASSTQVNGNSSYLQSTNGDSGYRDGVTSPVNANTRFTRISSPVNGDCVSPTFVTNTRSSGFSSPVNGYARNGTTNGHLKSSSISSTPKSYMATVNSSSRVYVSSPESEEAPRNNGSANGFFQGVSDWTERRNEHQIQETRQTFSPPPVVHERVQVLPSGPSHTFNKARVMSPYASNSHLDRTDVSSPTAKSSPFHAPSFSPSEPRSLLNNTSYSVGNQSRNENNQSSYLMASRQEIHSMNESGRQEVKSPRFKEQRELRGASPVDVRKDNGWAEHEEDGYRGYRSPPPPQEEPDPDYSPPHDRDSPPSSNKKLYQRTRFAADIPPPPSSPQRGVQSTTPITRSKSPGNIIGDSFRRLVGKFRSRSSERKAKRVQKTRTPSPTTYQQYNVIDNVIQGEGEGGGGGGGGSGGPVAPPRVSRVNAIDSASRREQLDAMDRRNGGGPVVQRYYLGEDPFGGSIYGREKEYDGVKRRSHHRSTQNGHRRGSHEEDDMNRANISQVMTNTSTLGRLSKSTSRLVGNSPDYSRTSQTLPRKLHVSKPAAGINVSIVNNVSPPKPARTYRSNLSRSQSFNVQPLGARTNVYTSNPSLNRIGESPAPLKSPAILASISRSQKDLTGVIEEEEGPRFFKSTGNLLNGNVQDQKKEIFMQGLMDRAPELFKTLHGDEMNRPGATSPPGRLYTSTPVRQTRVVETHTSTSTSPLRNGYAPLRNGLILDSTHSTGSSPVRNSRVVETSYTSSTRNGRLNGSTPLRNGRIVESSNSFRSSSTNDSDPVRHLSSPYRQPVNGDRVGSPSLYATTTGRVNSPSLYTSSASFKGDRMNSPSPGFSTSLTHSLENGMATSRSIERRGSADDYSETVRIKSKNDDPVRPSETNTVKSFSKKVIPSRNGSGRATETVESSETTTVTKSRGFSGGNPSITSGYTNRNGGVVIEVRPGRK